MAYDIPQNLISKLGMTSATVRFQVDNPPTLWLKNKVGFDPETVYAGVYRGVRRPTSFMLGININF